MSQHFQEIPAHIDEKPQLGFIARLTGTWFSPGETFADLRRSPGVVLPLIVAVIFVALSSAMTVSRLPMDKLMTQPIDQMVEEGRLTPEQAEQQKEQILKFAPYSKIVTPITAALYVVLLTLILAGLALLAMMMMGLAGRFTALWSVAVYSLLATTIIQTILFVIILMIKPVDEIDMTNPMGSNAAALLSMLGVSALPKFVKALLTYVDIFYIWKTVLLGIGFAAVTDKLKASTSITVCAIFAAVFAIVAAGFSAIFG